MTAPNAAFDYQGDDTVNKVATGSGLANTFVGYDGTPATSTGGVHDAQGITHTDYQSGDTIVLITCYSGLVLAAEAINQYDFVKPATDGSGKAAVGTATNHCGRALTTASAGYLCEVQVLPHRHT